MVCKRISAGENRWMMGNIGEADGPIARQGVLWGGDEIQQVVPHRYRANQRVRFGGEGDHGDLCATMEYFVVGCFRIEKLNIQCHCRVLASEGA
ncbi:hypothetical protein D3C79_809500 [compost metagenome]